MKRVLLIAGLTILIAQLSFAQTGSICLFSDPAGSDCSISDIVPGLLQVYVIHKNAVNVTAASFAAPLPDCMNAVWLGDMGMYPLIIGDSQNGLSVSYGGCFSSPIHILTMNIFGQGLSATDCPFQVLGHPDTGLIEVVDCDQNLLVATGGISYVNSMIPCMCGGTTTDPFLYVNPKTLDFESDWTNLVFSISNIGGGTLNWSVSESIPWLDATPTSGTNGGTISVGVDRSGLVPGYYSGLIEVISNGGNETVEVLLSVDVTEPALGVSPPSMTFAPTESGKNLSIFNAGSGDLVWDVTTDQTWLSAAPMSGVNNTNVMITVDRTGLPDGYYNGNVFITSNGGDGTVPVAMSINNEPLLAVTPPRLDFSSTTMSGVFQISNMGYGTLEWSMSANASWIEITPPLSGVGGAYVTINVDPAQVPTPGQQIGHVTVASNGGTEMVEIVYTPPGPSYGGMIGVYSTTDATDCNITEGAPGLLEVYVVHTGIVAATACQFSAPMPACMSGASYLSDTPQFPVAIGNSQTGVAIGYGACESSPIHVLTINYFASGATAACCQYPVLPDPNIASGRIEVVDCDQYLIYADGMTSIVNPNAGCFCGGIQVRESTWGKVKSLYAPDPPSMHRR